MKDSQTWTVCAVHVHTVYSDGTAEVDEIVAAARARDVDAVLVTDHHTMAAARHGWAGWHDGVLVIVGYEHSDPADENHLLVFGLDETMDPTLPAERYVREATERGGVTFVAHPQERRTPRGRIRPYPWTASEDLPFQGIEVWNFMSLWAEGLSPSRALLHYLFPGLSGERPDPRTLRLWDRCARARPVAGIAGLDAHALKVRWGPAMLTVFPNSRLFQGPLTLVATPRPLSRTDAAADTALVLAHLAQGHSIMGVARLGPLRGVVTRVDGAVSCPWGETLVAAKSVEVSLTLPRRARVRLVHEGRLVAEQRGSTVHFALYDEGLYRLEILRRGATWMLTNHVRIVRPQA